MCVDSTKFTTSTSLSPPDSGPALLPGPGQIHVRGLTRRFDGHVALHPLDLDSRLGLAAGDDRGGACGVAGGDRVQELALRLEHVVLVDRHGRVCWSSPSDPFAFETATRLRLPADRYELRYLYDGFPPRRRVLELEPGASTTAHLEP